MEYQHHQDEAAASCQSPLQVQYTRNIQLRALPAIQASAQPLVRTSSQLAGTSFSAATLQRTQKSTQPIELLQQIVWHE